MTKTRPLPGTGMRTLLLAGALVAAPAAAEAAIIATLSQVSPLQTTYTKGEDFLPMVGTPLGSVTGLVQAVDVTLIPGGTSGCDASDFSGFSAGNIALLQRGGCTFATKALNAEAAGATGVLIFDDVGAVFLGILDDGSGFGGNIPVLGTSFPLGWEFASLVPQGLQVSLSVTETGVTEAPEPATGALFAMTVVSLAARRRARMASRPT